MLGVEDDIRPLIQESELHREKSLNCTVMFVFSENIHVLRRKKDVYYLNLTLLEVMWSSQASQNALTAILAAAFCMGTLMCSTDVNTGASTRSAEREQWGPLVTSKSCVNPASV